METCQVYLSPEMNQTKSKHLSKHKCATFIVLVHYFWTYSTVVAQDNPWNEGGTEGGISHFIGRESVLLSLHGPTWHLRATFCRF